MIGLVALITQDLLVRVVLAATHTTGTVLALAGGVVLSVEEEREEHKHTI